jgi:hypothetical protein
VKKLILLMPVAFLCISFTLLPATKMTTNDKQTVATVAVNTPLSPAENKGELLYNEANLKQYGLSEEAFNYAWKGYQELLEKNLVNREEYLTICDFSQSSRQKRLYIIDVNSHKLLRNTWVAHGKNSGAEYATKFSNRPESLQSSLGFYVTADTYIGKHGLSLRMRGVDPGYNDKALMRTIVIHGAAYVDGDRVKAGGYMGRSWGCPAVPQEESASIINTIKNGTCLFIYHPGKNYLQGSKILNG